MSEIDRDIMQEIKSKSYREEGKTRLTCAHALAIAKKHNVKPIVVGRMCNEEGIKLSGCQLGCFQ